MASMRKRRLPQLEVRSRVDGAWYDGDIAIEGSQLRVHFNGFGRQDDEIWDEEFLRSTAKFREIVRLRSKQLQDSECKKALPGMVVCANYKTRDGTESKYYDAKILVVHPSEHHQKRGKELCKCQFKVVWGSGPEKDQAVILGCAEISLIVVEDVEQHPVAEKILRGRRDNSKEPNAVVTEEPEDIPFKDELIPNDMMPDELIPLNKQTDGLPFDVIAKLKNFDTFQEFLGQQAENLREALDMSSARK